MRAGDPNRRPEIPRAADADPIAVGYRWPMARSVKTAAIGRYTAGAVASRLRRLVELRRPSAQTVDLLLAAGLALLALAEVWPSHVPAPERWGRINWLVYAGPPLLALAGTVPLALRRRYPMAVMLVIGYSALLWDLLPGESTAAFLAMFVAIFSAGLYTTDRRRSAAGIAIFIAGAFGFWIVDAALTPGEAAVDLWLLFMLGFIGAIWWAGDVMRERTVRAQELAERAADLERRRALEVAEAATDERMRIARELHDVVAHTMSVMVIQAAAAVRIMDDQPERAREAMRQVESTGRIAMVEMRRLLGIVRRANGTDSTLPQPGLARLDDLIDEFRAAALPVAARMVGQSRPLPPGLDVSAYRIIQESLTNAMRHAHATSVQVVVEYLPDAVEISVTDDGVGSAVQTEDAIGHGLVGMHERVALFGGELETGPRAEGGFAVRARLPAAGPPESSR